MRWTLGLLALLVACSQDVKPTTLDVESDTDADADADADSDADADADSDADTDTGVDNDGDGFLSSVDCDDADETVFPGAPDVCGDERVTDCDRTSDDGLVTVDGTASFADLAAALAAATEGSDLLLCPGTYVGNFSASVAVDLVSFGGSAVTVLDGDALGTTLTVPAGSTVTGLTVTNGRSTGAGGGLLLASAGTLTVTDSVISANSAATGAGLSVPSGAVVVLAGTTVEANQAQDLGGGIHATLASIDLTTSVVTDNTAGGGGGGLALVDSTLVGGEVTGNHCPGPATPTLSGGGGIATSGTSTVTGTDVNGNDGEWGGGISASSGSLSLVDVDVHGNTVPYYASGGGAAVVDADLSLTGTTTIHDNTAGYRGAGVMLAGGTLAGGSITGNVSSDAGGGIAVSEGTVTGVIVSGNSANQGGGVYVLGTTTLQDLLVDGNTAADGGGVMLTGGYLPYDVVTLLISGGSITNNTAEAGGAFLGTGAEATIDGAILSDNVATNGGGIFLKGGSASVVGGAILRNEGTDLGGGAMLVDSPLVSEGADWGTGADDNVPNDVIVGILEYVGYEAGATFACADTGCTPAP